MGTQAQPADVAALVGLVDRLTTENRELVNAVAAWQSQAVVLAGRLADAEERLALTAPATPVEASTAPKPAQTAPEAVTGRWWRRWRAWLAAGLVVAVLGSASCGSGRPTYRALCAEASEFLHAWDYEVTNARMRGDDTGLGGGNSANWEAISLRSNVQTAAC
jgi:hypothetical protein